MSNKITQKNENRKGLESYIQRGNEIDVGNTKYVIISVQKDPNNAVIFEWFKIDTPLIILYDFIPLIDPTILKCELFYKNSKIDQLCKIEKNDSRTLRDIFSNHIAELQLEILERAIEDKKKDKNNLVQSKNSNQNI